MFPTRIFETFFGWLSICTCHHQHLSYPPVPSERGWQGSRRYRIVMTSSARFGIPAGITRTVLQITML